MRYLTVNHVGNHIMYSVYNSRGDLMLYTSNGSWASQIAESFKRYPETRELVVAAQRSSPPKRA
jgi:hypothetical protein